MNSSNLSSAGSEFREKTRVSVKVRVRMFALRLGLWCYG